MLRYGLADYFRQYVAMMLSGMEDSKHASDALNSFFNEGDLTVIIGAHEFFINQGGQGAEPKLIEALNIKGNVDMAETYLNCGNSLLEAAAKKWASAHGYTIVSYPSGSGGVSWGSAE